MVDVSIYNKVYRRIRSVVQAIYNKVYASVS